MLKVWYATGLRQVFGQGGSVRQSTEKLRELQHDLALFVAWNIRINLLNYT